MSGENRYHALQGSLNLAMLALGFCAQEDRLPEFLTWATKLAEQTAGSDAETIIATLRELTPGTMAKASRLLAEFGDAGEAAAAMLGVSP